MARKPQMTHHTLSVIGALIEAPESSGADVARATGLPTGTLYPILLRLEAAGLLESKWETEAPSTLGRPRRRLYKVTADGARAARSAVHDLRPLIGRPAWA